MQFENDADLAAAIETSELIVEGLVEVDWNRNGLYDHKYADMSWLMTRATVDAGPLSGDLPEEVNDVSGFASSTLTVAFGGVRYSDPNAQATWSQTLAEQGLDAVAFFDKYNAVSPIVGTTVEGTPIRYSRVVSTGAGPRTICQFTGWIRWPELDEGAGTVTITAGDVEDLAGALISLPVWAIGPGADNETDYNADGNLSALHPISAEWVYEECLRAAGRGTGPMPRPDAVAYWTVHGSWLPSVGALGGPYPSKHNVSYENTWGTVKYGLGHKFASWNDYGRVSGGEAYTSTLVTVPDRGSSDPAVTVGMAGWFQCDGLPWDNSFGSTITLALDDEGSNNPGYAEMQVSKSGVVWVTVYESSDSGGPNLGTFRNWQWNSTLAAGLHYLAVHVSFSGSAVAVTLRIDDAVVSPSSVPSITGGWKQAFRPRNGSTNKVVAKGGAAPCQHLQVYASTSVTYDPNQKHPAWYLRGDSAPPTFTTGSKNELEWLPDIKNRGAWEVLKEVAAGELGTLHTNEFGNLAFLNFEASYAPNFYHLDGSAKRRLNRDLIQNIRILPSGDRYRNAVSISYTRTQQVRKIVWQNPDPKQFYEKASASHSIEIPVTDVQGIYADFRQISAAATPGVQNLFGTQASAVRADIPGTQAPSDWSAVVRLSPDQRTMTVETYGASSVPTYIGAIVGATTPNFTVGGWGLDTKRTTRMLGQWPNPGRPVALLEIPDSPWRQALFSVGGMAVVTLYKTVAPLPLLDSITITADPRLQLRDHVIVEAQSGWYYCQIIGIRRVDGTEGSLDTLTLRLAATPNTWILDDPALSLLDSTTILN